MKRLSAMAFPALVTLGVFGLWARESPAQTTTFYSFTGSGKGPTATNIDGAFPYARLVFSGKVMYGTTDDAGAGGNGTVFGVNNDGTGFTNLHNFSDTYSHGSTNDDGANPAVGLVLAGNVLYGTASYGGRFGSGTVFKLNADGSGFTTLHSFARLATSFPLTNSDGAYPIGGVILSGDTLYGLTDYGGEPGNGTIFAIHTDGTGFTNLHVFAAGSGNSTSITNSDGAHPSGRLVLSGDTLYALADYGGAWGSGTLYSLKTNGTGFVILRHFDAKSGSPATNQDGANPDSDLLLEGNSLYGMANAGGLFGSGAIFRINTDGNGFTNLHSFSAVTGAGLTNADGTNPNGGLILLHQVLYGTADSGGSGGSGTVFSLATDGTGFTTLYSFTPAPGPDYTNLDGAYPDRGLTLWGGSLYGTASEGGNNARGALFKVALPFLAPPTLTILPVGAGITLRWPADAVGFQVQSTKSLSSPVGWTVISTVPALLNGYYVITNPFFGPYNFFRLGSP